MPERYYRVDVQFRNGASESSDAKEFAINVSNIGLGAEAERQADHISSGSPTRGARARRCPCTSSPPK